VYKLNYNTDEKKLKKDFEIYGPIKRVRIVRDKDGKNRGYGFIEYEHKADFKTAYKRAENRRIDNTPVQVDYERGRTEKNWKPRRFGGEKGNIREFPGWLERELRKIKEMYPELSQKYKKLESSTSTEQQEGEATETAMKLKKKSRSRSRDRSLKAIRSEEKKEISNENININMMVKEEELEQNYLINIHVVEENKKLIFEEKMQDNNEDQNENINMPYDQKNMMELTEDVKRNEDCESSEKQRKHKKEKKDKKDKKHKKDKKEKKHKKDKKEKKSKKEKKEKRDRRTPELEVGEIV
jgi:U1 small nuclear ribonucleoprotein